MNVKITKKPTGIPECSVACSPGVTDDGARQVAMTIVAHDAHGIGTGVGRVVLSVAEARDLAARLVMAAEVATPKQAQCLRACEQFRAAVLQYLETDVSDHSAHVVLLGELKKLSKHVHGMVDF